MAVFTTDVVKHGGRKLMFWAILLVVGCVQYAYAVKPTNVMIEYKSGATLVPNTRTYYAASSASVVLKCKADGGHEYLFKRFGVAIKGGPRGSDGWAVADTLTVALTDKDDVGMYTCTARDAQSEAADGDAEPLILTFGCTKGSPDPCVHTYSDANSKCDGEDTKLFCQCKVSPGAGVFPKCTKCAKAAYGGCDKAKHQICNAGGTACDCELGGTIGSCDACNATQGCGKHAKCEGTPKACACTYGGADPSCDACKDDKGCDAAGKEPRCDKGKCAKCNDAFCKTIKGKEVCDAKEGNCKAKGKTSDAATVTSTACLVIASVVVALMN